MKFAAICNQGQKRKTNQDSFTILEDDRIFVIADGMGGHKGGETASRLAVEEIANYFKAGETVDMGPIELDVDLVRQRLKNLKQAARQANNVIIREALINPEKGGMGTTLVMLQLCDDKAYVVHVGDSRLYRLSNRNIRQVTKDHSRLQELIDAHQVSPEEIENYPFKNIITRALGSNPDLEIDATTFPFSATDSFLLCTDGVSAVLNEQDLSTIVNRYGAEPEVALQYIAELVEERGSPDNYTAILIVGDDFMKALDDPYENTSPIVVNPDLAAAAPTQTQIEDVPAPEQEAQSQIDMNSKDEENRGPSMSDAPDDTKGPTAQTHAASTQIGDDVTSPLVISVLPEQPEHNSAETIPLSTDVSFRDLVQQTGSSIARLNGTETATNGLDPASPSARYSAYRKYWAIILLILGFYVTLCTINFLTHWVQYNPDRNTLDILKGNFHPFKKSPITALDVIPNEKWMMLVQNQEMKSALNRGKSFYRYADLNHFIAKLVLDIGQRYLAEGGPRERLIAVELFRKGRSFEDSDLFKENLIKALYLVGRDYETSGDLNNALLNYKEASFFNPDYSDVQTRLENLTRMQQERERELLLPELDISPDPDISTPS